MPQHALVQDVPEHRGVLALEDGLALEAGADRAALSLPFESRGGRRVGEDLSGLREIDGSGSGVGLDHDDVLARTSARERRCRSPARRSGSLTITNPAVRAANAASCVRCSAP